MQEPIDLVVAEEGRRTGGISLAVAVSFILHASFIAWFVLSYKPMPKAASDVPMTRYVELIKQNRSQFTEAPGKPVDTAPLPNAPLSDANRKAATPNPTGDQPTLRPGDGSGLYQPKPNPAPRGPAPSNSAPQIAQQPQQEAKSSPDAPAQPREIPSDRLVYRQNTTKAAASNVDWKNAIQEVAKIASLGGGDGLDLGRFEGGEKGTADTGPVSFESNWFDWGPYTQTMLSRLRVNWYANMPEILRTGLYGSVAVRFTIHRDGRISDITTLETSGVPPYDFAARKAIELSSPLPPLPENFPSATERVIVVFIYNQRSR